MAEFTLTARRALNGYERHFDGVVLREATGLAIVSMAIPLGGDTGVQGALKAAFGLALPSVGKSLVCRDGTTRVLRLGRDLLFALGQDGLQAIADKVGIAAYFTDQSDVWVGLEIFGTGARAALARVCMIDLHADAFEIGDLARTSMEHLGTIIVRTGTDRFLLLSATSSARSFLQAVETSVRNTQARVKG